jgi:hypothetical protein
MLHSACRQKQIERIYILSHETTANCVITCLSRKSYTGRPRQDGSPFEHQLLFVNWRLIGKGNDVGTFLHGKGEHWFLPAWLTCATGPNDKVAQCVELALVANDVAEAFNGGIGLGVHQIRGASSDFD